MPQSSLPAHWGAKAPNILVIASDAVEQLCTKNHLSFCDLLKPFGATLEGVAALSLRTSTKTVNIKNFGVRFVSPRDMDRPYAKSEEPEIVLAEPSEDRACDNITGTEDVAGFLRVNNDPTPWYTSYCDQFVEYLRFSEYEFLDHPITIVFAVSADEENPMQKVQSLADEDILPRLFQSEHFDASVHRSYVMVRDGRRSSLDNMSAIGDILKQMENTFGPGSASLVTVNSLQNPDHSLCDIWKPYVKQKNARSAAPQYYGEWLSEDDIKSLTSFATRVVVQGALPDMERRLLRLGEKVNATRRGFRNQVKLFFGKREPKVKTVSSAGSKTQIVYELTSGESQIRQLADFSFLMQDYETAVSNYRLVSSDYKADKAWMYYAGAQLMIGVCLALISDGGGREMHSAFDNAYTTYTAQRDTKRATWAAMLAADACKASGQMKDASVNYLRASEREPGLRGALLLEQAAYTFLKMAPVPQVRKYAFHLVMAGHLYHKCNHNILGVRCYTSGSSVYGQRGWFHVEDHINYNLGRDCFNLGQYEEAVRHFVALVGQSEQHVVPCKGSTQSIERQNNFLKEFIFVVKKWDAGSQREIQNLKLPTFLDESIRVVLADKQKVPASFANGVWKSVLKRKPAVTMDTNMCNKPVFETLENFYSEKDRACVVGERIVVKVTVANPLLVQIDVKNICLKAAHTPNEVGQIGSSLQIETQDIVLGPAASAEIELGITCQDIGVLRIEGINWEVCEVIRGFYPLRLPNRLTYIKQGGQRLQTLLKPNYDLTIPIKPAMPLLSFSFQHFPSHLSHGECVATKMKLTNHGKVSLTHLTLHLTHASFIVFEKLNKAQASLTPGIAKETKPQDPYLEYVFDGCYPMDWDTGTIDFDFCLTPGTSVELNVAIRGAVVGMQKIGVTIKYRNDDSDNFRLAHEVKNVVVEPLFNAKAFTKHSFSEVLVMCYTIHVIIIITVVVVVVVAFETHGNLKHPRFVNMNLPSFKKVKESILGLEIEDKQRTDLRTTVNFSKVLYCPLLLDNKNLEDIVALGH